MTILLPFLFLKIGFPLNSSNPAIVPSVPFTNLSLGLFLVHITTAPILSSSFSGYKQPFLRVSIIFSLPLSVILHCWRVFQREQKENLYHPDDAVQSNNKQLALPYSKPLHHKQKFPQV